MNGHKYGIAWNNIYNLGNERVDKQHKRLFELLSDLVDQCTEGCSTEYLKETLDFMVEYTVKHFYEEEALQVRYNFPDYKRHKRLHEDFKLVVGALVQKFVENGSTLELSNNLNRVIVRWMVEHIQQEDRKIGIHIRNVTARSLTA